MSQFENIYKLIRNLTNRVELQESKIEGVLPEENIYTLIQNLTNRVELQESKIERCDKTTLFKYTDKIVPEDEYLQFKEVELLPGNYIIEATVTYANVSIFNDTGVILGLFDNGQLIATGCAAWYGRVDSDDIYGSYQTVLIKGVLSVNDKKNYKFIVRPIGSRLAVPVTKNSNYPSILTIF